MIRRTALALSLLASPAFAEPIEIPVKDFPFDLDDGRTEDVHILTENGLVELPWIEITRDGDTTTVALPPKLTFTVDRDAVRPETPGTITSEDWQIVYTGATLETVEAVTSTATAIGLDRRTVERDGEVTSIDVAIGGFEMAMEADRAFSDLADEDGAMPADLDLTATLSADRMRFDVETPDSQTEDGRVTMVSDADKQTIALTIRDGRLDVSAEGVGGMAQAEGANPFKLRQGPFSYALSMPTQADPEPQSISFEFDLEDMAIEGDFWSQIDPTGALADIDTSISRLLFEGSVDGIVHASPFDTEAREAFKARGEKDFTAVSAAITQFAFDGMGLDVSGTGIVDSLDDRPSVNAFLSVSGLSEMMETLREAKLIPGPTAMMIEGMALQFAKEQPDGTLTYDIRTTDTALELNGKAVLPLPGAGK